MKGFVEIALVAAFGVMVASGFFLNVMIGSQVDWKVIAKETEIVKAVNIMESVKRGLPYALYYSYEEALSRGGYNSFSQVENKDKFEADISFIFEEYRTEIERKSGINVPGGTIDITSSADELLISFSSPSLLTYEYSSPEFSFKIFDNPNVTVQIRDNQLVEQF